TRAGTLASRIRPTSPRCTMSDCDSLPPASLYTVARDGRLTTRLLSTSREEPTSPGRRPSARGTLARRPRNFTEARHPTGPLRHRAPTDGRDPDSLHRAMP